MNQNEITVHRGVWMRIPVVWFAVSCPTGMPDTNMSANIFVCNMFLQIRNTAFAFKNV